MNRKAKNSLIRLIVFITMAGVAGYGSLLLLYAMFNSAASGGSMLTVLTILIIINIIIHTLFFEELSDFNRFKEEK